MLRLIALLMLALIAGPAAAYVGPGAGISVLGSLLGILATIFVAIGAILFWPIRKLMKRRKAKKETGVSGDTDSSGPVN
jgi:membrane protein implicated in regulation of membrane protease activity